MATTVGILLCHERSGSNLLEEMLNSHPAIECTGDVMNYHSQDLAPGHAFFELRRQLLAEDPLAAEPTMDHVYPLLDRFFAQVAAQARKPLVLVNLKYGHLHNVSGFWYSPAWGSMLLQYLKDRGMPLVHLYRRNVFDAVASGYRAASTGIWNASSSAHLSQATVHLPRERLLCKLLALATEINVWRTFSARLSAHTLAYEDFALPAGVAHAPVRALAEFLGVDGHWPISHRLIKISPPVQEYVRNFAELQDLHERFADALRWWQGMGGSAPCA